MTDSMLLSVLKDNIIQELIHDKQLFDAIDSPDITNVSNAEQLLNTHIFNYRQHPNALDPGKEITFLNVLTNTYTKKPYKSGDIWLYPVVEISIYSPKSHMMISSSHLGSDTRNDLIARRLLDILDGRSHFRSDTTVSPLILATPLRVLQNTEGRSTNPYFYRKLQFFTKTIYPFV